MTETLPYAPLLSLTSLPSSLHPSPRFFLQMVKMLDMLSDYLRERRYSHERLDGTVRGDLRQAAIDRFSKPGSDTFIFLLSTRAGGLGINLTAADTCIIFDSDWNPQNDVQAMARSHRIGQSRKVKVFRLVTRSTYESEMVERANKKLGLERAMNADRWGVGKGADLGERKRLGRGWPWIVGGELPRLHLFKCGSGYWRIVR